MGDTLGGELLARQLEGGWDVEITDRWLTNGSIYIELDPAQRRPALPPRAPRPSVCPTTPRSTRRTVTAGVDRHLQPGQPRSTPTSSAAQWEMIAHLDGHLLLPRLIRYVEERRRHEQRFTGAIERHPSPLAVVWGRDDPIAVPAMTDRLRSARPDAGLVVLDGVGHYPMVEAPDRFLDALLGHGRRRRG